MTHPFLSTLVIQYRRKNILFKKVKLLFEPFTSEELVESQWRFIYELVTITPLMWRQNKRKRAQANRMQCGERKTLFICPFNFFQARQVKNSLQHCSSRVSSGISFANFLRPTQILTSPLIHSETEQSFQWPSSTSILCLSNDVYSLLFCPADLSIGIAALILSEVTRSWPLDKGKDPLKGFLLKHFTGHFDMLSSKKGESDSQNNLKVEIHVIHLPSSF